MSRQRILVVEDEPAIADTIVYALSTDGFEPQWCATGGAAIEAARAGAFALAVLDVGLPDINGFELFKQLQQIGSGLPAIFLTARSSEIDKVVGLELGADDYNCQAVFPARAGCARADCSAARSALRFECGSARNVGRLRHRRRAQDDSSAWPRSRPVAYRVSPAEGADRTSGPCVFARRIDGACVGRSGVGVRSYSRCPREGVTRKAARGRAR